MAYGPYTPDDPLPVVVVSGAPPTHGGWFPPSPEAPLPVYVVGSSAPLGGVDQEAVKQLVEAALAAHNAKIEALEAVVAAQHAKIEAVEAVEAVNTAKIEAFEARLSTAGHSGTTHRRRNT